MLSDEGDELTQIGDELTGVGGMKVLLTKLRFFEKEWDLQEIVSLVYLRDWASHKISSASSYFIPTFR